MNKRMAAVLILCLWGGLPLSARPQGDGSSAPKFQETPFIRLSRREILRRLQLTPDQRKLLLQHRASYRKAMAELDGQLKVQQVELENELDKAEPSQDRLDEIVRTIGDLYGRRLGEKVKAKLELERVILTPQQLDLLRTLQGKESSSEDENL
jgi:hypothetical protein